LKTSIPDFSSPTTSTLPGETRTLDIDPLSTVEDLKSKLLDHEGIPIDDQTIQFGGRSLANGRTLSDYGLQKGSTIQLQLKLRGGSMPSFSFNKLEKTKILEFSTSGPKWINILEGISFFGPCKNVKCEVKGGWVYVTSGFGVFYMGEHKIFCPMCKERVKFDNCGFFNCNVEVVGELKSGIEVFKSFTHKDYKFLTFEDGDNEEYSYLKFKVTRL